MRPPFRGSRSLSQRGQIFLWVLGPWPARRLVFPQPERSPFLRKAVRVDLWGGDLLVQRPHPVGFLRLPPTPSEDEALPCVAQAQFHTLDPALPARCES